LVTNSNVYSYIASNAGSTMGQVTAEASFKNIGGAPFGGAAASPLASLSKPFNTIKKVVR
jgi:pantothenate kinase